MRDRLPGDWTFDLANRRALEARVEAALRCHPGLDLTSSSTHSFDQLDFQLVGPGERAVQLELKAKLQPLSRGWRQLRPDVEPDDLFVLAELSLRKVVDVGRLGCLLVRDEPLKRWVLWSAGDLLVASRVRTTRTLRKSAIPVEKGKLLLDLSEAALRCTRLVDALDALVDIIGQIDRWWTAVEPWPRSRIGA